MPNMRRFPNVRLFCNRITEVLTSYVHVPNSLVQGGNTFLQWSWPALGARNLLSKGKENITFTRLYVAVGIVHFSNESMSLHTKLFDNRSNY
jgi:hypothetical protein